MKKMFLFILFIFASVSQCHGSSMKNLGKNLGKTGFTLGCLSTLAFVAEKYQLSFSLGSLALGSFLLAPVAEEVYNPSKGLHMRNAQKFRTLLPCGLGGFMFIALGLKTLNDSASKSISRLLHL